MKINKVKLIIPMLLAALTIGTAAFAQIQDPSDVRFIETSRGVVIVRALRSNGTYQLGSGFIVSEDGLIATNFHVVVDAENVEVETKDGKVYPVDLVANYDEASDLFVLKVQAEKLSALRLGDSDQLKFGHDLFSIGHSQTDEFLLHEGKFIEYAPGKGKDLLMLEIPSEQGNSGGPIFNDRNEVVGISMQGRLDVAGFSYAIAINHAKSFFNYGNMTSLDAFLKSLTEPFKLTYAGDGKLLSRKYKDAIEYYQKALALDPLYANALIGLARAYTEQQDIPQALKSWTEVLHQDASHIEGNLYMGKYYFSRGSYEKAIAYMEMAAAAAVQSVHVYNDLGLAYGEMGNAEKAIEYYKKSITVDPLYATGYFNLSAAYYNKKDLKSAKEYCQLARKHGYNVPSSFLELLGLK